MTEIPQDPLLHKGNIPLPKNYPHDPLNKEEEYDPNDPRRMHDVDIDNFKTDEDLKKIIQEKENNKK